MKRRAPALLGVDTGGTFTDFLLVHAGRIESFKIPSTPREPARAFAAGWREAVRRLGRAPDRVVHGFTVATNALLTRRGARTAFLTTEGFEDLLLIGRQARPELYSLAPRAVEPLVPRALAAGVGERVGPHGDIERSLSEREAKRAAAAIARRRPGAVAVCLLHSYANPRHERALVRALQRALPAGTPIAVSHEITSEHREFERASTTAASAYLAPLVRAYLERLERVAGSRLHVMQSNGGAVAPRAAAERPALSVLSGPAGGVLGAARVAKRAGLREVLTLDVGGTSTDVAVISSEPRTTKESVVDGIPIRLPMLEIETVGAGGGSLARVDRGGALAVGPQSAGADPGPACYGRGGGATVTDAHVVLGRVVPDLFLGGAMRLDTDASWRALEALGGSLGLGRGRAGAVLAARGVVAVANAGIERALRVLSVARGHDVRRFGLVAFGGAGALHAAEVGAGLGVREILVPPRAGLLSAWGLLGADERHPLTASVLGAWSAESAARARATFATLEREARRRFGAGLSFRRSVELRYRGQSFEIDVPWTPRVEAAFHAAHHLRYGYARPDAPIEVVNVNLVAHRAGPRLPASLARVRRRTDPWGRITLDDGLRRRWAPIYERESLGRAASFRGPALVVEYGATTYVPPSYAAAVDRDGNLRLRPRGAR